VFAAWGRFVYRWRWATLVVSVLLLGASIYGLMTGGTLGTGSSATSTIEADQAAKLINDQLSSGTTAGTNFLLIFSSPSRLATDASFRADVEASLAPIQNDSRVTAVQTPYNAPSPAVAQSFISKDGHRALVQVNLKSSEGQQARADYAALRAAVHPNGLTVLGT
jgi:uncharacterized membrane protein YdfJ with MMPL/SSD domain